MNTTLVPLESSGLEQKTRIQMPLSSRTATHPSGSLICTMVLSIVGAFVFLVVCPEVNADEQVSVPVALGQHSANLAGTLAQQHWLASDLSQRQSIAEQIGVNGAERYAAQQSYVPLIGVSEKTTIHGPDGVYWAPDGKLVVIEAKGGTSPINRSYGYIQGTPENAIAGAVRMLKNNQLPAQERFAYETLIREAAHGNIRGETVRTVHVLGEPGLPTLQRDNSCSTTAQTLAKAASKELSIVEAEAPLLLTNGQKIGLSLGGIVGIGGGVLQVRNGVNQIEKGYLVDGSFDTIGGVGNVVGGSLIVFGKGAAGASVGAWTASFDGLKDVVAGVRETDTGRTVLGSVKIGAGSTMTYGLYTAQPVVIAAGGLTYTGVLLYENKDAVWNGSAQALGWTGGVLSNATDATWNKSNSVIQETSTSLRKATDAGWNWLFK